MTISSILVRSFFRDSRRRKNAIRQKRLATVESGSVEEEMKDSWLYNLCMYWGFIEVLIWLLLIICNKKIMNETVSSFIVPARFVKLLVALLFIFGGIHVSKFSNFPNFKRTATHLGYPNLNSV